MIRTACQVFSCSLVLRKFLRSFYVFGINVTSLLGHAERTFEPSD